MSSQKVESYLAAPKGLGLGEVDEAEIVGAILGDERGLGLTEALPDRGKSSNFLRPIGGVGGVELPAEK